LLETMIVRASIALVALLGLSVSCSDSTSKEAPRAECKPNQFRACESDACPGVQQCVDWGYWSDCSCTVLDASYADALGDSAEIDAAPDAGGDAEPGDASPEGADAP
jgi:hypothetical protein